MNAQHWRSAAALGIGMILVSLVACSGGPATTTGGSPGPAGAVSTAGSSTDQGPGRAVPIQDPTHVAKGATHEAYSTKPPTSGPHWSIPGEAPVAWGIYKTQVPDEVQVHNLEHGGIMIQYSCRDCTEDVSKLEATVAQFVRDNPLPAYPMSPKVVVAPYYDMTERVAVTAWGRIDTMNTFDEQRILQFIRAYRDKGPEAVP